MAAIQCELKRCGTMFLSSDAVLVDRQTGGRDWLWRTTGVAEIAIKHLTVLQINV